MRFSKRIYNITKRDNRQWQSSLFVKGNFAIDTGERK